MDKLGSKTIIGAGASFNGKIINARVIEINGKMNADLTADKVTIGEVGHFDGAIRADLVVVLAPQHFLSYPMLPASANPHRHFHLAPQQYFLLSSYEQHGNSTPRHDPSATFRSAVFQKLTLLQ